MDLSVLSTTPLHFLRDTSPVTPKTSSLPQKTAYRSPPQDTRCAPRLPSWPATRSVSNRPREKGSSPVSSLTAVFPPAREQPKTWRALLSQRVLESARLARPPGKTQPAL